MVERGVVECRTGTEDRPGTRFSCGKYEAFHSRMDQCAAAHRAGFQRHVKGRARQSIITVPDAGFSQYPNFRMGRGVVKLYLRVAAMGEHHLAARQYRTHGHLTAIRRARRASSKAKVMQR